MIAEHDPGDEDDAAVRCLLGCGSRATPRDGLLPACVRMERWWTSGGDGPPLPPQHSGSLNLLRRLAVPMAVLP